MYIMAGAARSRWLCTAVISMPPSISLSMTGFTSLSSNTRSPMTMACPPIGLNVTQPPSASAGFMLTPSNVTARSDRGKPYRCASPETAAFLPRAASTFCQSISCALTAEADKATETQIIIHDRLRIAFSPDHSPHHPTACSVRDAAGAQVEQVQPNRVPKQPEIGGLNFDLLNCCNFSPGYQLGS